MNIHFSTNFCCKTKIKIKIAIGQAEQEKLPHYNTHPHQHGPSENPIEPQYLQPRKTHTAAKSTVHFLHTKLYLAITLCCWPSY
jgi:hypothetical protein